MSGIIFKNLKKITVNLLVAIFMTSAFVLPVFAQSNNAIKSTNGNSNQVTTVNVTIPDITDPFGGKDIGELSLQVIRILFLLIIMAAVIVIVVAGFRMATGGGNPDQIKTAKKAITWAIIGLLVALASYSIVEIISKIF